MFRVSVEGPRNRTIRGRIGGALTTAVLIAALVASAGGGASAQLVVYDGPTTARNTVTAALKQSLYAIQVQQHQKIREMARRLSALTALQSTP